MAIKFSKIINIAAFPWWYLCNKPIKMQLGFTEYSRGSWLLLPCNAESHQVCWRRQNHGATAAQPGFLSPSAELMSHDMAWMPLLNLKGAVGFHAICYWECTSSGYWPCLKDLPAGNWSLSNFHFVSPRLNTRQPAAYFHVWASAKAWKYMHLHHLLSCVKNFRGRWTLVRE